MKNKVLTISVLFFTFLLNAQRTRVTSIMYEDETDIELLIDDQIKDYIILTKPQLKNINESERWFKIDDKKLRLYKVYYIRAYKTMEVFELRIWINKENYLITIEKNDISATRNQRKIKEINKGVYVRLA